MTHDNLPPYLTHESFSARWSLWSRSPARPTHWSFEAVGVAAGIGYIVARFIEVRPDTELMVLPPGRVPSDPRGEGMAKKRSSTETADPTATAGANATRHGGHRGGMATTPP